MISITRERALYTSFLFNLVWRQKSIKQNRFQALPDLWGSISESFSVSLSCFLSFSLAVDLAFYVACSRALSPFLSRQYGSYEDTTVYKEVEAVTQEHHGISIKKKIGLGPMACSSRGRGILKKRSIWRMVVFLNKKTHTQFEPIIIFTYFCEFFWSFSMHRQNWQTLKNCIKD